MKQVVEQVDSSSGRTPSDNEKQINTAAYNRFAELPPDPDAGLSKEEKARIVRPSSSGCRCEQ